jgi:hypothetical protein
MSKSELFSNLKSTQHKDKCDVADSLKIFIQYWGDIKPFARLTATALLGVHVWLWLGLGGLLPWIAKVVGQMVEVETTATHVRALLLISFLATVIASIRSFDGLPLPHERFQKMVPKFEELIAMPLTASSDISDADSALQAKCIRLISEIRAQLMSLSIETPSFAVVENGELLIEEYIKWKHHCAKLLGYAVHGKLKDARTWAYEEVVGNCSG